ncbi:MAG TPA: hypothetical protein VEF76_01890 [Patescibacteria group bacterium]|nr:hypothetical protein [Patescibacteria group bacterium]
MPDLQSQFLKKETPFDFAEAVAEARRDYPKETANITFFDLASPEVEKEIAAFAEKANLNGRQYDALLEKVENKRAVATEMNGFRIVAVASAGEGDMQSFPGDEYKSAYFAFQHELGHFVVKDAQGLSGRAEDYKEHAADTFAVIRGLQAGVLKKSDLLALSDKRGQEMLMSMDFAHMTSMSLDAIAINPKNIDFLSLSKQDIAKVAQRHANTFESTGKTFSKFSALQNGNGCTIPDGSLRHDVIDRKLDQLLDIAMSAPADSQEFYLAARVLNNVLETGKLRWAPFEHTVDVSTDHWREAHKALLAKAGDRDIGAKKAHKSVSLHRPGEEPKNLVARIAEGIKPLKI